MVFSLLGVALVLVFLWVLRLSLPSLPAAQLLAGALSVFVQCSVAIPSVADQQCMRILCTAQKQIEEMPQQRGLIFILQQCLWE
jgi:hypothetical protein